MHDSAYRLSLTVRQQLLAADPPYGTCVVSGSAAGILVESITVRRESVDICRLSAGIFVLSFPLAPFPGSGIVGAVLRRLEE